LRDGRTVATLAGEQIAEATILRAIAAPPPRLESLR